MRSNPVSLALAACLLVSLAACSTPAAQRIRSDVRTLPDVFRTGVNDAKTAADTVATGLRPAPEAAR